VSEPSDDAIAVVHELMGILKGTGIAELELEYGDLKVHIQRDPDGVAGSPVVELTDISEASVASNGENEESIVSSGYVGEFHREGELPAVGDQVASGAKIGEIFVLGMGNPVLAPTDGVLTELLVADQAPVEYGQPLAVIRHRFEPPEPSITGGSS
jgi:acetyl-CoA carboxylase biotin carboxyl carrier protein